MRIKGNRVILRTAEISDADFIFQLENNPEIWPVSGTRKPYSRQSILDFLSSQKDLYLDQQLRLMICTLPDHGGLTVGCIDLFDYNPAGLESSVGVAVLPVYRKKGWATDALALLIDYAFNTLFLRSLSSTVHQSNADSLNLFLKFKFILKQQQEQLMHLRLVNNQA